MDDELELEVTDLRTGRAVEAPLARERGAAEEDHGGCGVGDVPRDVAAGASVVEAPVVERMRPAGTPAMPRALLSRRARGYLAAGVVLLVCTAIFVTLPGAQQSIRRALAGPTPTPTATLPPDESTVYLVSSVPWGTLTVDGHTPSETDGTLAHLNYGGSMVLHLARGRHTIAYRAEPFAAVTCRLSVPTATGDTCLPATNYSLGADPGKSRVIDLGASLDRLPSDQLPSLDGAAAATLGQITYTATVAPGDHYLGADGAPAVAAEPLAATLSFTLNSDPNRAGGPSTNFGAACVALCAGWDAQAADTSWQLIAHAVTHWTFTASDGRIESPSGGAGELDVAFLVSVAWQGRWTITSVQLDPALDPCGAVVTEDIGTYPNWDGSYSTSQLSGEPTGGCAVEVNHTTQPTTSAPSQPPQTQKLGALLYRYGVLLAADDAAHRAKPELPVASAHERALAEQALEQAGV